MHYYKRTHVDIFERAESTWVLCCPACTVLLVPGAFSTNIRWHFTPAHMGGVLNGYKKKYIDTIKIL